MGAEQQGANNGVIVSQLANSHAPQDFTVSRLLSTPTHSLGKRNCKYYQEEYMCYEDTLWKYCTKRRFSSDVEGEMNDYTVSNAIELAHIHMLFPSSLSLSLDNKIVRDIS